MIQGNLASGKEISKIILKKIETKAGMLEAIEEREFTKCIIQLGYSDTYQDFVSDCKKFGKAAAKIELTTWKVS